MGTAGSLDPARSQYTSREKYTEGIGDALKRMMNTLWRRTVNRSTREKFPGVITPGKGDNSDTQMKDAAEGRTEGSVSDIESGINPVFTIFAGRAGRPEWIRCPVQRGMDVFRGRFDEYAIDAIDGKRGNPCRRVTSIDRIEILERYSSQIYAEKEN
jgi:hypothetical protein